MLVPLRLAIVLNFHILKDLPLVTDKTLSQAFSNPLPCPVIPARSNLFFLQT